MAAACRLIEIWGSPRDRGLRYGAAAEPEIRRGVKHYLDQMAASGLAEASVAELAEAYVPRIADFDADHVEERSEEHTSELQSLMRISYAVFCLKKKKTAR